jgi:hypothetical protein
MVRTGQPMFVEATESAREGTVLSMSEQRVLQTFRQFRVTPGQMLCFCGPDLARLRAALQRLTEKDLLIEETFQGGYSLTPAGFAAMKDCD